MAQKFRVALALFGLGVLSIVAVELVARVGVVLYEQVIAGPDWFDIRAQSPAYGSSDQAEILYRETRDAESRDYRPYIGWTHRPFQGTLVNINPDGDRVTTDNSARDDSLRLWVLGGSTVWGLGAPDSQTIPSHLATLLNDEWKVDTVVRNMGESAFVSTQELARLILELQQGNRPDVVVIYDGANDVYVGAYSPGVPGAIHNLEQISSRVEGRDVWGTWIRSLGIFRAADFALRKIGLETNVALSEANSVADSVLRRRAVETAEIWLQNYQVASALAETYGFELVTALQPNLFVAEKPLQPYEQEILREMEQNQPAYAQGTRLTYSAIQDRLESRDYEQIYDLSDAFDDIPASLYIDDVHPIGTGNRRVAEMLYAAVQSRLCENIPDHASRHVKNQIMARCTGNP